MQTAVLRADRALAGWSAVIGLAFTVAIMMRFPAAPRFALMGAGHILSGFDHLAFLVMLVVATRSFKDLIAVITMFTLGHSITLSAVTLNWVMAPPGWVEPLIALTILYVALENLFASEPRGRLLLAFGFGLIHGLGFANGLVAGPLSRPEPLLALFSFNLGIESGQILFLSLTYPAWMLLRQQRFALRARHAAALIVALLCAYWLWERL